MLLIRCELKTYKDARGGKMHVFGSKQTILYQKHVLSTNFNFLHIVGVSHMTKKSYYFCNSIIFDKIDDTNGLRT